MFKYKITVSRWDGTTILYRFANELAIAHRLYAAEVANWPTHRVRLFEGKTVLASCAPH